MTTELLVFALVTVAGAVAMVARRFRLPYTVALVVTGLGLGVLAPLAPSTALERVRLSTLFHGFLPILLFEAAYHLSWERFRKNLRAVLLLAVPGVGFSIALGGAFAFALAPTSYLPFPIGVAFLFVAILAATDPVSVVALFKELGVPRRLAVLMEGESLLNDGVGIVAFLVTSALLGLDPSITNVTPTWVAGFLLWEIVAGLAVGTIVGLLVSYLTTLVDDHLVEIMLTTIAAFGAYLLATLVHASPVLAAVASGMACGNVAARYGMTPTNRLAVETFWEYAVFAANGFVFLLLGMEIDLSRLLDAAVPILVAWLALLVVRVVVVVLVARALSTGPERIPPRWIPVLAWGGLRGGLSMVLALSLPEAFEHRAVLLDLTFGVVLVTILVQGPTMERLLRWAGATSGADGHEAYLLLRGRLAAAREARVALDRDRDEGDIDATTHEALAADLEEREAALEAELSAAQRRDPTALAHERARTRTRLLEAERSAVQRGMRDGTIPDDVGRRLLDEILERGLSDAAEPEPPRSS